MVLNDESLMPWGKYKGIPIGEVPAEYLLWLYEEKGIHDPKVHSYVLNNLNILRMQMQNKKKGIR